MNWFDKLRARSDQAQGTGKSTWQIHKTREPNSLLVRDDRGRSLAIIAGRQIATDERLEVLALGLNQSWKDGGEAQGIISQVASLGAVPVLPWAVGKWTGRRKRIVEDLLRSPPAPFLLGDNSGRLALWPEPGLLDQARRTGVSILPGSDALPFKHCESKIGSYGLEWADALPPDSPFEKLRHLMLHRYDDAKFFGGLANPLSFVRDQLAIQLRNLRRT